MKRLLLLSLFALSSLAAEAAQEISVTKDFSQDTWIKTDVCIGDAPAVPPALGKACSIEVLKVGGQVALPYYAQSGARLSVSVCLKAGSANSVMLRMPAADAHITIDLVRRACSSDSNQQAADVLVEDLGDGWSRYSYSFEAADADQFTIRNLSGAGQFLAADPQLTVIADAAPRAVISFDANGCHRWNMSAGSGFNPEGNVSLGVPLQGVDREASLARGGDGMVARFEGGKLMANDPAPVLKGLPDFTLYVRLKPEGEWIDGTVLARRQPGLEDTGGLELSAWNMPFWDGLPPDSTDTSTNFGIPSSGNTSSVRT